jgi:hypothetical protein
MKLMLKKLWGDWLIFLNNHVGYNKFMKFLDTNGSNYKTDLAIVFILYSISFFLLLINFGVFWDDWVLYNVGRWL